MGVVAALCWALAGGGAHAEPGVAVEALLPAGEAYDQAIPTPADVLGFEIGERHFRHDELVSYFRALAAASDRIVLEEQGRTHEGRPQLLAVISAPQLLDDLEGVRRAHLGRLEAEAPRPSDEALAASPLVVWLAYSIHGNEASGAMASAVVAYHLAASTSEAVGRLLAGTVVLVDPSQNPDGMARFAQWVNGHRSRVPVADPEHREHAEGWPSGRTNHYWFDLNRDWLPAQHPESRARLATFDRWRPTVVGDFHEMGSDRTYFFQPGVPSRTNPSTPARNQELTRAIAELHAAALDAAGRLYFTQEVYDDYYYGKGSTYPDANGSVGILFEQASARGLVQETDNGRLTLAEAIGNQVLTSLSTLEGAATHHGELLRYQADFAGSAWRAAENASVAGRLCTTGRDAGRLRAMAEILAAHGVSFDWVDGTKGEEPAPGGRSQALSIPSHQGRYRLIETLFERRLEYAETTFYDVSTWALHDAFAADCRPLDREELAALAPADAPGPGRLVVGSEPPVAYAFGWDDHFAPRLLGRLLEAGLVARVATRPLEAPVAGGSLTLDRGAVIVPMALQSRPADEVAAVLKEGAEAEGIDVWAVERGLSLAGVDLGSPSLRPALEPRAALVVGRGVDAYAAGELWHLLDHRFRVELTLLERDRVESADLDEYTHLFLVDGAYDDLGDPAADRLTEWVRRGGALVASQRAATWAAAHVGEAADGEAPEAADSSGEEEAKREELVVPGRYGDYQQERAAELLAGAIVAVEVDETHPLGYGYPEGRVPVFRTSTLLLEPADDPYANVAVYGEAPLVSGYASARNVERLAGTPAVVGERLGEGVVILVADDLAFRGFFYGSERIYLNALYLSPLIDRTTPPEDW